GVGLDRARVLVDQQHLVAVLEQLGGNRPADRAGSGDPDPHASSGPAATAALIESASASDITRCSTSPSWSTTSGVAIIPSPSRVTKATRTPVPDSESVVTRT